MATFNLQKYAQNFQEVWDSDKAEAFKTYCRKGGYVRRKGTREYVDSIEKRKRDFEKIYGQNGE